MADAFFLEIPKGYPAKCLSHEARQGGKLERRPYFHHTVEMKQPPTYNSAFFNRWRILCLKHILTLFLGVQERKHQSFPMMLPC